MNCYISATSLLYFKEATSTTRARSPKVCNIKWTKRLSLSVCLYFANSAALGLFCASNERPKETELQGLVLASGVAPDWSRARRRLLLVACFVRSLRLALQFCY